MHARGSGAHGTFTVTDSKIQKYSKVERHIANCTQADPAYGAGVRAVCLANGALTA